MPDEVMEETTENVLETETVLPDSEETSKTDSPSGSEDGSMETSNPDMEVEAPGETPEIPTEEDPLPEETADDTVSGNEAIGTSEETETVSGNTTGEDTPFVVYMETATETTNLWETPLAELSSTDTLLLAILLVLLIRLLHDIVKGSHWFNKLG